MRLLLVVLLALAIPTLLATTNVRLLAGTSAFYEWGFRRHAVGDVTGLSPQQLRHVASEFIAYFAAAPGRMTLQVRVNGHTVDLFNEREIAHMVDVQALMRALARAQIAAAIAVVAALVGLALLERRPFGSAAGLGLVLGSATTIGLLLLLAAATLFNFDRLWTRFHLVAFSNDLWMLDPARDRLIQLFPPGFWLDATLLLAGMTLLEALLIGTLGLLARTFSASSASVAQLAAATPRRTT